MPPDPIRGVRWGSRDEEQNTRRLKGELSCAECKRLKHKCDKKVPCGSCERRGCQKICPTGTLSHGQASRYILADTVELHRVIAEMSQRIQQLETALADAHANLSNQSHPLLMGDLLAIKFWPGKRDIPRENRDTAEEEQHICNLLGTLSLNEQGEAKYYGQSAGLEVRAS
ncbi:hypothetical protein OE88DRAFT_1632864 [Heliocybe sulcata]|uniref:Zn(2)-C6 fungal-type domain-containing protein n=1 Tax=Heliocybe sulcata TaxID=5364 RepID=A0A5C3MWM3_9AGAM|nr:hypothetical protein OE88DRAFT_1632864 [Heliocybe sulcata]